ncbi:MarR family transcriptional regulator [Aminobacter anthyllidis]|uniref:MarR family transcriptional regulator n=1 Tax=Aminobacter anthyllidis TaxID=1035067 RepID=A0A9X1A9S8_9HYPH|nr:MarR family transcriptional regulator [Aminobacter anthyllidis]MBT1155512.1 MarR family transcriptional regulator [Aminobacter anthyllidis]MDH4985974.1 MarR family transcriptional regulator [Aminobacter anthyllidis]
MSADELKSAFFDELLKVNRKLRTMFDARVKKRGLTLARARLMMQIAECEGKTQAELAEQMHIEQPSLVGLIDGLEKKGLVVRCTTDDDRRAKRIFLTPIARREADSMIAYVAELRGQVLAGVDDADIESATRVLAILSRNIGEAAED